MAITSVFIIAPCWKSSRGPSAAGDALILIYPFNKDSPHSHSSKVLRERSRQAREYTVWFHLYKLQSQLVISGDGNQWEVGH